MVLPGDRKANGAERIIGEWIIRLYLLNIFLLERKVFRIIHFWLYDLKHLLIDCVFSKTFYFFLLLLISNDTAVISAASDAMIPAVTPAVSPVLEMV